jgi:hypothetical protein
LPQYLVHWTQRSSARDIQIADLCLFCSRLPLYYSPVLAKLARVIALVAFWGCLRLGTFVQETTTLLRVFTGRDFFFDTFLCPFFRYKTVKHRDDCHWIVLEPLTGYLLIWPLQLLLSKVILQAIVS